MNSLFGPSDATLQQPLGRLSLLLLLGLLWATALSLSGILLRHPQTVPVLAFTTTGLCSLLAWHHRGLDALLRQLGLRLIVAAHATRFVGGFLLWGQAHGHLPQAFGRAAGIGDLATAGGALALLLFPPGRIFRGGLVIWNTLGFIDLLNALRTAAWLNLHQPGSMDTMTELPWVVIPLIAVPLMLASHIKIFQWLLFARDDSPPKFPRSNFRAANPSS